MANKKCSRRKVIFNKFKEDWDELNVSYKSLILVGVLLFIVVILITFFSDGGQGTKNTIEIIFRSTMASVFGFLLSSNIRFKGKKKSKKIEEIKDELNKIELNLDIIEEDTKSTKECELEQYYDDEDMNLVQIAIALGIAVISICVLGLVLLTNDLDNVPSISQIRDLMCTSIGFLIGASKSK